MANNGDSSCWSRLGLGMMGCLGMMAVLVCGAGVLAGGYLFITEDEWIPSPDGPPPTPQIATGDDAPLQPVPTLAATAAPGVPTATPTLPAPATPRPAPTPQPQFAFPVPSELDQRYIDDTARAAFDALLAADYPPQDFFETAVRLGNDRSLRDRIVPANPRRVGDVYTFEQDGNETTVELLYITEDAYFWVDENLDLNKEALVEAADFFQSDLYPRTVDVFGQEWRPGVDDDPRFSIFHLADIETAELGFFDSGDVYPATIFPYSNEQEVVYLNMGELELGDDYYYGTLVHEFQHLIQWHHDPNETTWLDEGLGQLAEWVNGYDNFDIADYTQQPNLQLNSWAKDEDVVYAHYGAAALFAIYLHEQLGDAAVYDLAHHPANGMASVAAVLDQYTPPQPLVDFVDDWYVANYVRRADLDPRYGYADYTPPALRADFSVPSYPFDETGTLNPFGVRYIELPDGGARTLSFAGDTLIDLIPAAPYSGETMWLAPAQNNTAATLSRPFDLRDVDTAELEFQAWYDLEEDYDYAYVLVSDNNGRTWQIEPATTTDTSSYGAAFNGRSTAEDDHRKGWVPQVVNLDEYVGREIIVRFEVLTDSAIINDGFAVDDIRLSAVGYASDVEQAADRAEWLAAGFVPVGHTMAQQWSLQLVVLGPDDVQVLPLTLDAFNQGQWELPSPTADQEMVLVLAPVTPFTTADARYWLSIE